MAVPVPAHTLTEARQNTAAQDNGSWAVDVPAQSDKLDSSIGSSSAAHGGRDPAGPSGAAPPQNRRVVGPSIVAFDPDNLGSGDDEDDDEDDSGSSKKKRKTRSGARATKGGAGKVNAEAAAAEAARGDTGSGSGQDDKEPRRKIEIGYIEKKEKRHITFSKRKAGIMKKAYELATLTGTEVLLLVVSETGIVYTFTTTKFQPLVGANPDGSPSEGQRLIQQCLAVNPDEGSNYISPPPDGPLLPLPPSARKRPFEANSSQHGGQIALRTRQQRPKAKNRPPPIGVPGATSGGDGPSLPTPGIHATLDQHMAESESRSSGLPHPLHGLPIPPPPQHLGMGGSAGNSYPPSPSYPPGHPHSHSQSELPSPMHPSAEYAEMMDRGNMHYGGPPPMDYPPPPALGYSSHHLPPPPLHHRASVHSLESYPIHTQPPPPQQQHPHHQHSHQHRMSAYPPQQSYPSSYGHSGYAAHSPHDAPLPSPSMRGGPPPPPGSAYFEQGGPPGPPPGPRRSNGHQPMYSGGSGGAGALPSPAMHPHDLRGGPGGPLDEDLHMMSPSQGPLQPPPQQPSGPPGGVGGRGNGGVGPNDERERLERRHSLAAIGYEQHAHNMRQQQQQQQRVYNDGRMGGGEMGLPPPPLGGEDAYMRR